jgi:hypothetical protein
MRLRTLCGVIVLLVNFEGVGFVICISTCHLRYNCLINRFIVCAGCSSPLLRPLSKPLMVRNPTLPCAWPAGSQDLDCSIRLVSEQPHVYMREKLAVCSPVNFTDGVTGTSGELVQVPRQTDTWTT